MVVFVVGIAGMIVGSIADNDGIAISFGLLTATAAVCLMSATWLDPGSAPVFDEVQAARLEERIEQLVAEGADESELRDLVRQAVLLGRRARV